MASSRRSSTMSVAPNSLASAWRSAWRDSAMISTVRAAAGVRSAWTRVSATFAADGSVLDQVALA